MHRLVGLRARQVELARYSEQVDRPAGANESAPARSSLLGTPSKSTDRSRSIPRVMLLNGLLASNPPLVIATPWQLSFTRQVLSALAAGDVTTISSMLGPVPWHQRIFGRNVSRVMRAARDPRIRAALAGKRVVTMHTDGRRTLCRFADLGDECAVVVIEHATSKAFLSAVRVVDSREFESFGDTV